MCWSRVSPIVSPSFRFIPVSSQISYMYTHNSLAYRTKILQNMNINDISHILQSDRTTLAMTVTLRLSTHSTVWDWLHDPYLLMWWLVVNTVVCKKNTPKSWKIHQSDEFRFIWYSIQKTYFSTAHLFFYAVEYRVLHYTLLTQVSWVDCRVYASYSASDEHSVF